MKITLPRLNVFSVLWFLFVLFLGVNIGHFGDVLFPHGITLFGLNFYWGLWCLLIIVAVALVVCVVLLIKNYINQRRNKLKAEIKSEVLKELGF